MRMEGNARPRFTPKQRAELWDRWRNGQCIADIARALERRNKSGVSPLVPFFLGEEIDIGAAGRESADVSPSSPRPLDIHLVVVGLLPGRGDVDNGAGVAVSDRGVAFRQAVEGTVDREKNDPGMR